MRINATGYKDMIEQEAFLMRTTNPQVGGSNPSGRAFNFKRLDLSPLIQGGTFGWCFAYPPVSGLSEERQSAQDTGQTD